ncbi:hypothetical protein HBH98_076680 [Parastagonospora nodorum]|nr:hypothetical protein HBH51_208160 [Parastagonospora nodorum]KAH4151565.1 hypothetical protein HBH43_240030 [Parastagonospora nodorum]KAH4299593.1 hypothetical protein HBI01_116140 [Parastagonospora nodorum]KAH4303799.1 hypothetical protein HBI02_129280 [Parastagonospora nodorum]KAH4329517.1 hypothetical protein HBI00_091240 [Parastagonospora nodorum]
MMKKSTVTLVANLQCCPPNREPPWPQYLPIPPNPVQPPCARTGIFAGITMKSLKISASQPRVRSQLQIRVVKSMNRKNEWSTFVVRLWDELPAITSRIPSRRASTVSAAAIKLGRVPAEHD